MSNIIIRLFRHTGSIHKFIKVKVNNKTNERQTETGSQQNIQRDQRQWTTT